MNYFRDLVVLAIASCFPAGSEIVSFVATYISQYRVEYSSAQ